MSGDRVKDPSHAGIAAFFIKTLEVWGWKHSPICCISHCLLSLELIIEDSTVLSPSLYDYSFIL